MRVSAFPLLICVSLLALAAPAAAQEPAPVISLLPGDALKIEIWREPDLSGEFPADENGMVVLPLLGPVAIVGIPMSELRAMLTEQYQVHLRNPSIAVTPLRRINVLGEVNRPGLYGIDPTITLGGVVGIAGGSTVTGDINRIRVVRDGQMLPQRFTASATLHAVDIRSGDQIIVEQRGWFERNSTFVVSMLLSVTSIIISLAN